MVLTVNPERPTIAYLLLVHEHPELCARLASRLLRSDQSVVVHLDQNAPGDFHARFDSALGEAAKAVHWAGRVPVRWGDWSMVEATLAGLDAVADNVPEPDHVVLLSGADYPLRPLTQLEDFLARHRGIDFIECVDADAERWVRDGPQQARYRLWHGFNWQRYPRLFDLSLRLQRRLGVHRTLPNGLHPHVGAQWWTLTGKTCERVRRLAREPSVTRFFRRTWIPDELFFATAVASLVPPHCRRSTLLTHCLFDPGGTPVVFYNGQEAYLAKQPAFFARKLSPEARELRDALDTMAEQNRPAPDDLEIGETTDEYKRFMALQMRARPAVFPWAPPGSTFPSKVGAAGKP